MTRNYKNPVSQLVIGLALSCTSVMVNTGIVNQIVLAKTNHQEKCNILAYIAETDSQGLNVRSSPSNKSKILGKVPINETVKVITNAGDWVRITNANDGFKGTGWVFVANLGLTTRGYGSNGVDLYANSIQESRKLRKIPADTPVKLLGCQGDWAHVEYQGVNGWLTREDQCGAALTSCS